MANLLTLNILILSRAGSMIPGKVRFAIRADSSIETPPINAKEYKELKLPNGSTIVTDSRTTRVTDDSLQGT